MRGRGGGGCCKGWKLQVISPFKSTHSFWVLPVVQMTQNVCWDSWSLREVVGRSQMWKHGVKEIPAYRFSDCPIIASPQLPLCPTNPGISRHD